MMILIRSALFNAYFYAMTFILVWPGMIIRIVDPDAVLAVVRLWARLGVAGARVICGIRVEVEGLDYIPDGAALIAAHHESAFDTLVWFTLLPRCCYVLKQELLRIPLLGALIRGAGLIAVDRRGGGTAIRQLLKEADRAVREQRQIVIFPEGTRAPPGTMLALQPGIAALAARTGLPVVPVATDSGTVWGRRAFRKRPGTIRIVVRPPLPPGLSRDALMARLPDAMRMDVNGYVDNSVGAVPGSLVCRPSSRL
jgi:1-acyl-sn-glycerol-3-phosphate acyltransferase